MKELDSENLRTIKATFLLRLRTLAGRIRRIRA